jgi:hypothetical protein
LLLHYLASFCKLLQTVANCCKLLLAVSWKEWRMLKFRPYLFD